jgi:4-hydroxybenzoate polyprenyltransferase
MKNKKANLATNWVEYLFIVLLILGLALSLLVTSAALSYLIIIVSGVLCGRYIFQHKASLTLPLYLLMFGFVLGYVLGGFNASRWLIIIFFILSCFTGFYTLQKGYVP